MARHHLTTKKYFVQKLLSVSPIHVGEWQAMDVSKSPFHATHELLDVLYGCHIPTEVGELQKELIPDLPWAENHFRERVSGKPYNPPPSHTQWPWAVASNEAHIHEGQFDHTYPERFWPKYSNCSKGHYNHGYRLDDNYMASCEVLRGIRFQYGDLEDVLDLLARSPFTRQAYLPVWFPEDTGAISGQRVPCTLGYHFLLRPLSTKTVALSCRYYIRSCDILRHFTNDVYLAGRLMQWMVDQLNPRLEYRVYTGQLIMYISSLHAFVGDKHRLEALTI